MKKINEYGRSMVEMLGVLAIVGVLSAAGLMGFSKALYTYRMSQAISQVSSAIRDFVVFEKQDARGFPTETKDMAKNALTFGLIEECVPLGSMIAGDSYGVCKMPLGEIYPRFFVTSKDDTYYYTYMLYVTFLRSPQHSCANFLSKDWGTAVPRKFWKRGVIWITSSKGTKEFCTQGEGTFSVAEATKACSEACSGSNYCSVIFDFSVAKF